MWRDEWALVTGASSGIGREFAHQLAAGGMHVALVARRADLLEALAQELTSAHQVQCLVLAADLSADASATELRGRIEARGVRIRLLVNNAAQGHWGRAELATPERYASMLRLNNEATVRLCLEFFGHLSGHPRSAIINVSSQAALQPVPFMAVYAASKAFVHAFSVALYEEWKEHGIHVQTLIPGPTRSEFDERAGAYESALQVRAEPGEAVSASLAAVGKDQPVVASVKGIFKQRLLNAVVPPKRMVHEVAKLFRPRSPG